MNTWRKPTLFFINYEIVIKNDSASLQF